MKLLALALAALLSEPLTAPGPDRRGVVTYTAGDRLVLRDPRTLRPIGPVVAPADPNALTSTSPGGRLVAAVGAGGSLEIIQMATGRSRTLRLRPVTNFSWCSDRRLAVTTGSTLRVIDPRTGRQASQHALRGQVETMVGDVVLLSPKGRIGVASLNLPDGRQVAVLGIRAGWTDLGSADGIPHMRGIQPALAVDRRGGAAYVASAESDAVVRVDLGTGRVEPHGLGLPARAAKATDFSTATAVWLEGGRLASTRTDEAPDGLITPWPLRLTDTRTWRSRELARRSGQVERAPGGVVAAAQDGTLTMYERSGRVRFRVRIEGDITPGFHVAGRYVYAQGIRNGGAAGPTKVIALRTGRVVGTLAGPWPRFVRTS
jgi:hypothetical protein